MSKVQIGNNYQGSAIGRLLPVAHALKMVLAHESDNQENSAKVILVVHFLRVFLVLGVQRLEHWLLCAKAARSMPKRGTGTPSLVHNARKVGHSPQQNVKRILKSTEVPFCGGKIS